MFWPVAILAQARRGCIAFAYCLSLSCPLAVCAASALPMEMLPHQILADLHGRLLRQLSSRVNKDFQGLAHVGRDYRKAGLLSGNSARRLVELDYAVHWNRHATMPKSAKFHARIMAEIEAVGNRTQPEKVQAMASDSSSVAAALDGSVLHSGSPPLKYVRRELETVAEDLEPLPVLPPASKGALDKLVAIIRETHDSVLECKLLMEDDDYANILKKTAALIGRCAQLSSGKTLDAEIKAACLVADGDSTEAKKLTMERLSQIIDSISEDNAEICRSTKEAVLRHKALVEDPKPAKKEWVGTTCRGPGPSAQAKRPHGHPPANHGGSTHSPSTGFISRSKKKKVSFKDERG